MFKSQSTRLEVQILKPLEGAQHLDIFLTFWFDKVNAMPSLTGTTCPTGQLWPYANTQTASKMAAASMLNTGVMRQLTAPPRFESREPLKAAPA